MEQPYSKRETDMLLKRIDENIEEGFRGIHERLDKLNGQVAKNTEFRQQATGVLTVAKFFGAANIIAWIAAAVTMLQ